MSFPNAAIVTVLEKQVAEDLNGQDIWLAEVFIYLLYLSCIYSLILRTYTLSHVLTQIQSRRGLIAAHFVNEQHTLCDPKHSVDVSLDFENMI